MTTSPHVETAEFAPSNSADKPQSEILLVEDDAMSLLMFEGLLNSLGYQVKTCRDGIEALNHYSTRRYPILITDWRLPRLDGMSLCQRIRTSSQNGPRTYCLLVTGSLSKELSKEAAAKAGVDAFLSKPVRLQELRQRLEIARQQLNSSLPTR